MSTHLTKCKSLKQR